jgi:hypothetical protein
MRVLKSFLIIFFTSVSMFSSSSEVKSNTESDYLIFYHCDGRISVYNNGSDCTRIFGENGDGSFSLVYSVGC